MDTTKARYDKIGVGYDSTRKADTYLTQRMYDLLEPNTDGTFLDVGCGTGNYTSALSQKGLQFVGIDPSEEMLDKARTKSKTVTWKKGTAENIDLEDESVDGVLASLTIHHWKDLNKGFAEIYRVMKRGSRMVLFTTLPTQTRRYWLNHYFPVMIANSTKVLPTREVVENAFEQAGLKIAVWEPYHVKPDLEDGFLYVGKYNPERYFDENTRRGISSFSLIANQPEVEAGLKKLRVDIDNGVINEIIEKHEYEGGDYLFLVGEK